jgi:hypothetical protein
MRPGLVHRFHERKPALLFVFNIPWTIRAQHFLSVFSVFSAALLVNYFHFKGPLEGVPVILTHGPTSAVIGQGRALIDVVRGCPSLGSDARYTPAWWLWS